MITRLAKFISRLLDLYTWSLVINILFLTKTGLSHQQFISLSVVIFLTEVILPVVLFIIFLKKKIITDVDISLRNERPFYFTCLFLLVGISSLLGMVFGTRIFFLMQLTELFLIGGMVVITLFWKISGHSMINAAGVFFINYFFAWKFWWLFLILIPVGWSRLYLRKHNFLQLLAGALLGTLLPLAVFKVFDLL